MPRLLFAALAALLALPAAAATPTAGASTPLDLETIMADADWMGQPVENPYWSVDGRSLYYELKREGSSVRDLYRVDPASGSSVKLDPAAMAGADGPAVFDRAHRHAAFVLHDDIFLVDLASGQRRQVTLTAQRESAPQFSADGRALQYRAGNDWYSYDLAKGVSAPVAELKFADDPQAKQPDDLGQLQLDLFKTLRAIKADKEAVREHTQALEAADAGRAPRPFWLGGKIKAVNSTLSPNGRWLLLVTEPRQYKDGKAPVVNHYVTDSGYTEAEDARTYVGRADPAPQSLLLLDLAQHKSYPLTTDALPGIKTDPLAALRKQTVAALEKAGKADQAKALKAPEVRPVTVNLRGLAWSEDGANLAVQLRAIDNKDRWIASVDFTQHVLTSQHRLTDPAWINWSFNDFGWLKDGRTLWYLSEQGGYSRLYAKPLDGKARALTGAGKFEVSAPQLSEDGQWFYVLANKVAPYSYDVYRVPSAGGELSRLTQYQGVDGFELSPDGRQLAVLHGSPYRFDQLAVVDAAGGTAKELTHTMKSAYMAHPWIAPKIVEVPSAHGAGVVYAKYYGPADEAAAPASRPAVIFIHGAGYLQDAHSGWSYYWHEFMFDTFLTQHGYIVMDMDYRGSAGYGRDWRTAIYRQMGHPEVEDITDGAHWLEQTYHADPKRLGVWGGSYGGFMTYMMMFRQPDLFQAGAALRPVADWADYNDGYTAAILNRPDVDPQAYFDSSPINYAGQLKNHLLIMQGIEDDNVFFIDTVHMTQKLIELRNPNFDVMFYPVEHHDFHEAASWLDEYRRIWRQFNTYVDPQ